MNGVANGLYGGDLPNQINTPWIDFSEQSTIVGWSSYTTKIIRYKVVGKMVFIDYFIQGTSNSTNTSFTVPIQSSPTQGYSATVITVTNNGTTGFGKSALNASTTIVNFANGITAAFAGSWTASGTKLIIGQFFYEI